MRHLLVVLVLFLSLASPSAARACASDCTTVPPGYARGNYDAVAGAAPSADHPRGTIVLGYAHKSGPRVVEWDVEHGVALRTVGLGGAAGEADVALASRASGFVAVVASAKSVTIVLLDARLRKIRSRRLGHGRSPAVVVRGADAYVTWLADDDRASVARWNATSGDVLARVDVALAASARQFPRLSIAADEGGVVATVGLGAATTLVGAPLDLSSVTSQTLPSSDAIVVVDADVPRLLASDTDGHLTIRRVHADLTTDGPRVVTVRTPIVGAFGPDHVLALPGLLVPLAGDPQSRGAVSSVVFRILWVGSRVVNLESSDKMPTLMVRSED